MFGANKVFIVIDCGSCGRAQAPITVEHRQLSAWRNGAHIQTVMPELSPAQRELLISGTCDSCFSRMFGGDDE